MCKSNRLRVSSSSSATRKAGAWALLTLAAGTALAGDLVWTNTAGGNWTAATGWDPNGVPGPTDTAWITNNGAYSVTLNTSVSLAGLHLGGTTGTQTLNHTLGTLTLGSNSDSSPQGVYALSGGTLTGWGALNLAGPLNWSGGGLGGTDSTHPAGGFTLAANGGLVMSGTTKYLYGGALINAGPGSWSAGVVYCYNTSLLTNAPNGTLDLQADGNAFLAQGGSPSLANAGTLRKNAGTGTSTITVRCNNSGSVQANSGTLALTLADSTGGFSTAASATLSLNGAATLSASASVTGAGNFSVSSGGFTNNGTFNVSGTNAFSGGTACFGGSCSMNGPLVVSGGSLILNGAGSITPTSLIHSGGSLLGTQPVTVSGLFNWSGGYFGGIDQNHPTSLTVTANGGLVMSGTTKYLYGGTLINAGSGSWSAGIVYAYNTSLLTNAPTGTLDLQADGNAFLVQSGSPSLANAGTLRKSAGTGTSAVTLPCRNSGSVQANSGTLALTVADSTGSFTTAAGATLSLDGTATFSPAASITGTGSVGVSGNSSAITNSGTFNVSGSSIVSGGTACFLGSCSMNGPVVVSGGNLILNGAGAITTASLTLSSGSLAGTQPVTISGLFNWSGGYLGGIDQNHPTSLTVTANGGLVMSGTTKYLCGGTLVNAGLAPWGGGAVYCYNNSLLTNAPTGTLDVQADGYACLAQSGSPSLANAGTLRKSAGTGTSTITLPCRNSGSVQANSGTLALTVTDSTGSFSTAAGATLSLNGTATLSATASVTGTGSVVVSGSSTAITNSGSITSPLVVSGGILGLIGAGAITPASLTLSGGSLLGTQPVSVSGPFNWSGGSLGGIDQNHPTSLTVTANGSLVMNGTAKFFFGGTLVNAGPGSWSAGMVYVYNTSLLTNAPTGTLDLQTDGTAFSIQTGSPSLANAGTLRKSAGSSTSTSTVPCSNSGSVQANSGTLALTLVDGTGSFTTAAGATLSLNGTATLSAAASVTGAGSFSVSSGSITNNGAFNVSGTNAFIGGTACFGGSCSMNGPLVVSGGNLILNGVGAITPVSLSLSSGSLLGTQPVSVSGAFNWSGGSLGGIDQYHPTSLTVTANGSLVMNGTAKFFSGGTLVNAGAGSWSSFSVYCYNNALLTNAPTGTLDLQTDGTAFSLQSGSPSLANAGTLRKSAGSSTSTSTVPCSNSGSVQANSGTLALTLVDGTGSFTTAAGATLSLNGTATLSAAASVTGTGSFSVSSGGITNNGTFNVSGTNAFSGGTACFGGSCSMNGPLVVSGGNLILNGAGAIAPASLSLSAGSLSGTQPVSVSGASIWSGGSLGGIDQYHPTSLTVTANGSLVMNGTYKYLFGGTLINSGAGSWSANNVYCYNNALLTNAPTGTLDLQADGTAFWLQSGSPSLANAGTLRKSAGTGTSTISLPCNNSGVVQAAIGTLSCTGRYIQTAGQTSFAGGNLGFGASPMELRGGRLTGQGSISGSVSNSATIDFGASPGMLSISGDYTETSQAQLQIKIGGTAAGTSYDQLAVGGNAALAGTLTVSNWNGFTPSPGDVYTTLVCKARSGVFSAINSFSALGAIYFTNRVVIEPGNASPTAQLVVDPVRIACHTVFVRATGSDSDGSVTNLAIFMGTNLLVSQAGATAQVAVAHDFPEDVTFTALATDNKGAQGGTNLTVSFVPLATHVLDPVGFQSSTVFKLCLEGESGKAYKIQAINNLRLTNWTDLGVMENTNGIWRYLDVTATNAGFRYYRAQQLP